MRYFALALALTLSPVVAFASDLKIASWNIEHLAEKNGAGCKPRQDSDYQELRKYAARLDADIVAFQEVESARAAARVFDPKIYKIEISAQKLRAGYQCDRDNPSAGKSTKQLSGFAIKKTIPYKRNPDFKALDVSSNQSLRWAVDVTLKGKSPIRLLSVHLKASCPSKSLSSTSSACQTLLKQQPILEERWMEARYKAGEPFIVLGDFNRHLLTANDDFWAMTDDGTPTGMALAVLEGTNEAQCDKKYPKRIDHIVVDGRAKSYLEGDSFQVLKYDEVEGPSDHCPISASLKVNH